MIRLMLTDVSFQAKKGLMTKVVLTAFVILTVLFVPPVEGKQRFDKAIHECHSNKGCIHDYNRRRTCNHRQGVRERECYVRYAARYYLQDPANALRVAKCESYDDLQYWLTYPQKGMWQFVPSTWARLPLMFSKHSPHSVKYSSLGAMWMWSQGRKGEWDCK